MILHDERSKKKICLDCGMEFDEKIVSCPRIHSELSKCINCRVRIVEPDSLLCWYCANPSLCTCGEKKDSKETQCKKCLKNLDVWDGTFPSDHGRCNKCGEKCQPNSYHLAIKAFGCDLFCPKCHVHINSKTGKDYSDADDYVWVKANAEVYGK